MGALMPPPAGTRTLAWHYRSRDERLIAFSNAQPTLYDFGLTTFPGVSGSASARTVPGIGHVLAESATPEVDAVVRLVLDARRGAAGRRASGVIAMGITHAERIEEAVRAALAAQPALSGFFDEGAKERFFVKNLERVQGDERDAIILSVGYGKTPTAGCCTGSARSTWRAASAGSTSPSPGRGRA